MTRADSRVMIALAVAASFACVCPSGQSSELRDLRLKYQEAQLDVTSRKYDEALAKLRPLKAQMPESTEIRYLMFQAYFHLKKWDEAAAELRELINMEESDENKANYKRNLAACYSSDKKYTEAISVYNDLMTEFPDKPIYPLKCGICHELAGNSSTAEAMFQKVISMDPESDYATKATKYLEAVKKKSQISVDDAESEDDPGGGRIGANYSANASGPSDSDQSAYTQTPTAEPQPSPTGNSKSPIIKPGTKKPGPSTAKAPAAVPPELLSEALSDLNGARYDDCIAKLTRITGAYPRHAQAHYMLGVCYSMKGDRKSAIAHYKEVIAVDPLSELAHRATDGLKNLE